MTQILNKNILISSAGRRVELVKIWQKELKNFFGKKVFVFANDLDPELSSACAIADKYFKICPINDDSYTEQLFQICLSNKIGMVIPTIDSELIPLSRNRDIFAEKDINILISDLSLIKICRNKFLTKDLFSSLGINYPEILDKNDLSFPLIVKPFNGSSSKGVKKISNNSELSDFDLIQENNMFQLCLPPNWIEYSVDLLFDNLGNLVCCVPRERIATRGGEISKGATRKNKLYEFVLEKFQYLEGARGPLTLQIFSDPKGREFSAIELNARFGGGYPMSYLSGANYPKLILEENFLDIQIKFTEDWQHNKLFLRHDNTIDIEV